MSYAATVCRRRLACPAVQVDPTHRSSSPTFVVHSWYETSSTKEPIMSTATKPLEQLIHELSPTLRAEVRDFVEFLLTKHERSTPRHLRQDWAEVVKPEHAQLSSVDLQHRA